MIKYYLENLKVSENITLLLMFVLVASFLISFFTFKPLLAVIVKKRLHDEPNFRSSHKQSTPTIGGVAIYVSLVLVICLFGSVLKLKGLLILIGCLTWLFFAGLNDDLSDLKAIKKAMIQLVVSVLMVFISGVRVFSFFEIFGVGALSYPQTFAITVFVYMLIINAFNLIDGIDGLSGGIAVMISLGMCYLFINMEKYSLTALSLCLIGALLPFLRLNFSEKRKIFMGDSGSMIVGFVIAYLIINFISKSQIDNVNVYRENAPIVAIAILFYPLLDTTRIFFKRIFINRTSPFKADRNHIHHKFLDLGFSHKKATLIIITLNTILFLLAINVNMLNINIQLVIVILFGVLLFSLPFVFNKFFVKK